jgi:pimeloyl-ACP methyl ester carboxylesterase
MCASMVPTGIPILLIHGWSQSHLCWSKQLESTLKDDARIVALDLRGHGMSDAPMQADQYTDGDKWADDIVAVIDGLALDRPILVGWSYGGYIISDYVLRKGQGRISGINFVAAAVVLGSKAFGTLLGPGFVENAPGACQDDLPTNIAAIRRFLRACIAKPISHDDFEEILAFNMVVNPKVEAGDKTKLHRVFGGDENDGNRRGCSLGRQRHGHASERCDHCDLPANQVGRQRRQSIDLILAPAVHDRDVLALDVAAIL